MEADIQKVEDGQTALSVYDFGEDAGKGFENTTNEDYSISFISVLQALSPQVTGQNKLPGAEAGMLFNTATQEVISGDEGIRFVPLYRTQVYVEWIPRTSGGGYVGQHQMDSDIVSEANNRPRGDKGQLLTSSGNELVQTAYMYGMLLTDEGPRPAIIAFTSTKLKVYRNLMTQLNSFQINTASGRRSPPLFAHQLLLRSAHQSNKHGDFFNFKISPAEGDLASSLIDPSSELYAAVKEMAARIGSGEVQVNFDNQDGSTTGGGGDDEEAPF